MKKNRENTEKKIIDAAYAIIERDGFESLGINAVAKEAQVSKVLILLSAVDLLGLKLQLNLHYLFLIKKLLGKATEQSQVMMKFQN